MNASTVANSQRAENLTARLSPVIGSKMDMFALTPITHITKTELFDEDIMLQMCVDDRIPENDRKQLSAYYRRRTTIGRTNTEYQLSKVGTDHNIGRLYVVNSMGLQHFRFDIRNPLLAKHYHDVDIENCHYNIALKFAKDLGLPHTAIQQYCENRDQCLKMVSDCRKTAKTCFLKLAYGGDIKLYREDYSDNNGMFKPESEDFRAKIKREMDTLAEVVYGRNERLHKVKCGAQNKAIEKRPNKHSVLLSYIFQTEERKCLMALDSFLTSKGRYMGVLIHDGGCVEKLEGELEFPKELLIDGAAAIKEATGYDLRLTVKPLEHNYTRPERSPNCYARMKSDFERNCFLIGATICEEDDNGRIIEHRMVDAKTRWAHLQVSEIDPNTMSSKKVPFLKKWTEDPSRRFYRSRDFIPNRDECPTDIYNTFTGFAVEELLDAHKDLEAEEILELIQPIIHHIGLLCGMSPEYVLRFFAQMIQFPNIKCDVAIFLRDMGGLLKEGGGVGKDTILDWFGRNILGSKYYLNVDDNSSLYGSFNSVLENKLLIYVQEACGKDNYGNYDKLKALITKREALINKKMIAQYSVQDFSRWVFASNNANPLPIRNGDRRFAVFDVSAEHRNNKEYFTNLYATLNNDRVKVAFYKYLKGLDTWRNPIEFQVNRPITSAYIDLRQINAAPHYKWLVHCLRQGTLPERCTATDLYQQFSAWYSKNDSRAADHKLSATSFGKLMKEVLTADDTVLEYPPAQAVRCGPHIEYRFDFERLIKGLEALHLLKPSEVRFEDGCLIATGQIE
jgi:hypothetical protein